MGGARDIPMSVKMNHKCFPGIEMLSRGECIDEDQILEVLHFIDTRYDCADFRLVCILRSLYAYPDLISKETLAAMKKTVLGFRYWMDEPGQDSMCFWSENHQLLFATCEYLAGQLYPGEIFSNSGMTGEDHSKKGKAAIQRWLKRRFEFGFSEFHSNTYYEEDIAPLSLLTAFSKEEELRQGATILLDLLLLDLALHQFEGYFCAASGRCYEVQKKDPQRQDVLDIMKKAFGFHPDREYDYTRLSAEFVLNKAYHVPKALQDIARWGQPLEIHDSMGIDLTEVKEKFQGARTAEDMGAYLWAMEAFTNPESVNMTMRLFRLWNMRGNDFLKDLKVLDKPFLRRLGLLPPLVSLLNPVTQGVAIQRGNVITYKTGDYMLSAAQHHHPGEFGDQQHIWQATLSGGVTVFTTHPGAAFFEDNARNFSPSYWVGNGVNPDAAQHKNVLLCLYRLNVRQGVMEKKRQLFTHAWFPQEKFDEVRKISDRLYLGRKGDGYIALFASEPMREVSGEELIQDGVTTGWAAVMGSAEEYESFDTFAAKMQKLHLTKTEKGLALSGPDFYNYALAYKRGFYVSSVLQDTAYPRLDCPFAKVERDPQEYFISSGENSLKLNLSAALREGLLTQEG